MSRLVGRLDACRAGGRKALVTFITAGDPDLAATVPALHALVRGGADVLELGIPFSDPEAEGPVIQLASERGLAAGTTLRGCLELVAAFRRTDTETPVVLMGYLNSLIAMGYATFAAAAAAAGVDGLIMVNLPPEEAAELEAALAAAGIPLIFLVAPTTTDARARMILEHAAGFVYYVSLKGITGSEIGDHALAAARLRWLRGLTALPVMAGFGIKDGATAVAMAAEADGVVVGSALVATIAAAAAEPASIPGRLEAQVREIRTALDRPPR
ncbi:MAG: tryptophan synthase subunit alpha [Pseudomonadales bacterium]|nr:tryptophan synthase subunit alpha [Pseudomonadales bacterium]